MTVSADISLSGALCYSGGPTETSVHRREDSVNGTQVSLGRAEKAPFVRGEELQ